MKIKNFSIGYGASVFKAFSEEARIRIIHLIQQNKQMCVADLEQVLDYTQTKISRHLIYLKNCGLLNSVRIEQWTFYFLKEGMTDVVAGLLKTMDKDLQLIKDQEIYRIMLNNRELAASAIKLKRYIKTHENI